jgi:hypothetical protein
MKRSRDQLKKELMEKLEEAVERVLDWQEKNSTFTLTDDVHTDRTGRVRAGTEAGDGRRDSRGDTGPTEQQGPH